MAELSVADYEAALDDITRRGVAAIRHIHPQYSRTVGRRPIAQQRPREQRSTERIQPLERAETTNHALSGGIVETIRTRPYATLALAGLIGFACAALRR
jgi:hypothetical protein